MTALRFAWAILTWTVYQVVTLPLDIAGLFLVPIAIWRGQTITSPVTGKQIFTAPTWMWLYGNDQEGYDAPLTYTLHPYLPDFLRRYCWAALRNRVNNLRFIKCIHPPPNPLRIKFVRGWNWWLCWQGPLYGFRYNKRNGAAVKIGWRYDPDDIHGIRYDDWRKYGCGFTFRLNVR
jgi:hypothetical protein